MLVDLGGQVLEMVFLEDHVHHRFGGGETDMEETPNHISHCDISKHLFC